MRRREFITLLGGVAALSPFAAHAQQADRVRRVGILLTFSDEDAEAKAWLAAFRQGLERRGWREGRNLHIDIRSASARGERIPGLAKELIALQPDVLLAQSTAAARALQRETQTLPIVFVHVSDPIGAGIVSSLARPEANLTGVLHYEAGIVGKWLAMLKEMSPRLTRVAVLANSKTTAFDYFLRSAQGAASSLGVEVIPSRIETAADIERAIEEFARLPDSGLLLPPDATTILHQNLIVSARGEAPAARGLSDAGLRQDRWLDVLWNGSGLHVPAGGLLRRSHPARRQAGRSSGAGADPI